MPVSGMLYNCVKNGIVISVVWGLLFSAVLAEDIKISTDNSSIEQNNPVVAAGLNGHFIAAWIDYRNGYSDVFGQLMESNGTFQGVNFVINDDNVSTYQLDADLSSDWYGRYYAVWKDYRNNTYPFGPDIYYQKMDSTGLIGDNLNVTVEIPDSSHKSPAIGTTGWGKTIVAWTDLRSNNWDIYAQLLSSDATIIGNNVRVNDDNQSYPQHEPAVGISPEGWYVVAWYDGRNGNDDIYLQKFDSAGQAVGTNIKVNDDNGETKQKFPDVAVNGDGTITVVWTDWRNGNYPENSDIYGQRFDKDLNRQTGNFRVNLDFNNSSQRDARVDADRLGNICIVWSDSSGGEWNITAQMIESTGHLIDNNFRVNNDEEGSQIYPDVALDGNNLYFVWADNRNGNYDIYGCIKVYNDPSLVTIPETVEVFKDISDPDPEAVKVLIDNAGYGAIEYGLMAENNWISLSKSGGQTPDSFYVSFNATGMDYGNHLGQIRLINVSQNDSSQILPVIMNITGPEISFEPSALSFHTLLEIGLTEGKPVVVKNSSSGTLDWTASVDGDWLSIDVSTGLQDDTIIVACDPTGLTAGQYEGHLIVSDDAASNSPESLLVTLDLESDLPFISIWPENINHILLADETITDSLMVLNLGSGSLNWQGVTENPWVGLGRYSGTDNDWLTYSIYGSSLNAGTNNGNISISDEMAFNSPYGVSLTAEVRPPDTVFIEPVTILAGSGGQAPLNLSTYHSCRSAELGFSYDTAWLAVDSFKTSSELTAGIEFAVQPDSGFFYLNFTGDGFLKANQEYWGDLFLTAAETEGQTSLSIIAEGPFSVVSGDDFEHRPVLSGGLVDISMTDSVGPDPDGQIPNQYCLEQNYPNPFNSSTRIKFSLARGESTRLEVFNILGQRMAVLVDEYLPAGNYDYYWSGYGEEGREIASGIYFYKITSGKFSYVRKMICLK